MKEIMPLIPLRGITIFPSMVLHFDIGREKSILALEKSMVMDQLVFLTSQKDAGVDLPTQKDFYRIGTVARVKQMLKLPGDNIRVLVDGQYRARAVKITQESPYFLCEAERIEEPRPAVITPDCAALMRAAVSLYSEYAEKHPNKNQDSSSGLISIEDPGRLADIIISNMEMKVEDSQKVLSAIDPVKRLRLVMKFLTRENEILDLEGKISAKVKDQMSKNQREYYLREQLRAIQEELGQGENLGSEADEWKKKLRKLKLSPAVTEKIEREIDRFSKMAPGSPDAPVIRNYVEWILGLPWNKAAQGELDINRAEEILNEDHYGLEKVKTRILEYLAVKALAKNDKGPILCLVGPPGVGKTSVARSVARAVGREFVHMSLGGVRDEAEIRGHRRTYIGAVPGRIMSEIRSCGSSNPVFLFDEVDKIGADFRGDPASALLEVLDPEQNREFVDHYLEVPFDLSGVLFICTANTTDTIPRPLLDRMELITISGYTDDEKLEIARKYLIPKQIKASGLTRKNISINRSAIKGLIDFYTRESGVRGLEKEIANLCRKVARKVVAGETGRFVINGADLEEYLGRKRFHHDKQLGKSEIGVATGLAWTVVGGETLFIEAVALDGAGHIQLTGQLGDVMQESAKAAISYIRANAKALGVDGEFYKNKDIHIHIPEGATPKDGPSAGVTMCTAVISALSGRRIRRDVAMTGEITLRGTILPVGGIKEKMLAAYRMGIRKALLPADNEKDLEDIAPEVRDRMEFVLIKNVGDALKEALL